MRILVLKFIIISLFFTSGCGFKVINQSELAKFDISEINTTGNKVINFKLKNKLLFNSKANDKKLIKINLESSKTKGIKEKNIKNEITKYDIYIKVKVLVDIINSSKSTEFVVSKTGSYNVHERHSITLRNEKNRTELLVDDISEEILFELRSRLDDL